MRLALVAVVASAFVVSSPADVSPGRHLFNADDWARLRFADATAVSPDGKFILYQVSFGGEKGPTNHEWNIIHPDGTAQRKLDFPADFTPVGFTHDGAALYGLYKINNLTQFATFSLASAAAASTPQAIVMLPRGTRGVVPSPDGSRYALLADPRPPDSLAEVRTLIEPDQTSIYVVESDGTRGQWWCSDLKDISGGLAGGSESSGIAWSPDSALIAVLSITPKIGYNYVHSYLDACSASGSHRIAEIANAAGSVAWLDSGKMIAFLSTTSSVLTPDHVWTVSISGGKPTDRTPDFDASAVGLAADPRGHVWVLVNRGVRTEIDEFRDYTLTRAYEWPNGFIAMLPAFSEYLSGPAQLAFSVGDPEHATNVAVPQGDALHRITAEGDDQIAKTELGPVRDVHWRSKEGISLEGIVTFPAGYTSARAYPFLVFPHGGPEASDLLAFDGLARVIAGLGYVVLQPEYRGSTGYGTRFLEAIYQHFGDRAFRDVDSATDYAIAQHWADPNRLAIFGWSAGGFMTAWTVTQTSRYRAAIEGAGITDWSSFMWTSDVQQIDYDARWPDQFPDAFRKFSAVDYSANVRTPLLILHGGSDHRVPTFQGLELFEALAARSKTTRMVEYPGSPHFPALWEQRRDVCREIADWLKRYNP